MKYLRRFPYWYLLAIPVLLFCLGVVSNQAVLVANHGKFPVMMNPAWMDLKCTVPPAQPEAKGEGDIDWMFKVRSLASPKPYIPRSNCKAGGEMIDMTHSIMGPNSHLKALSDIFPIGNIYSIGDGLLYLGGWLLDFTPIMWLALAIRKMYADAAE